MAQETKQKQATKTETPKVDEQPTEDIRDQKLADKLDDLLDEIDSVLEENAEEFVSQYIQKGGQ